MNVLRPVLVLVLWLLPSFAPGGSLPPAERVLAKMQQVNDRFLRAWPNPGADIVTDRARPSNIWTRATYFEGLMALHQVAPEARYYDYAVRWGESHAWGLAYGSTTDRNADDQACGQTYLDLYAIDPRPERIRDIKLAIDNMVNSTKSDDWWWIDALHMAMPVFARLGVLTGDQRYFNKMYDLYSNTRSMQGARGLYNPVEHLWWRDGDFDPPYTEPSGANCYWSRGNGWVLMALARVLDVLPPSDPHYAEYLTTFKDMSDALVRAQRPDGFWNPSLLDPASYGARELTGTAMFAYGLAWGVRKEHLGRSHLDAAVKAWNAMADFGVRPDGSLAYMQGSGKQPSDWAPITYETIPNFDDYGTGAFLLAGTEIYKLAAAPAIEFVVASRTRAYAQLDANTVVIPDGTAYRAEIRVLGTGLASATMQSPRLITFPDARTSKALTYDASSGDLIWSEAHVSPAALATVAPDGNYAVSLPGKTVATALTASGDSGLIQFPATPKAIVSVGSWSNGKLNVNTAQALTVTLRRPSAPTGASLVSRIEVAGADYRDAVTSNEDVALTIPAHSLGATQEYAVTLTHALVTDPNAARINGVLLPQQGLRSQTTFTLSVQPATFSAEKLVNLSARGTVAAGAELIVGFVVSAGSAKTVLVRGAGPALTAFGVSGAWPNPVLRVTNANRTRAWQNDDWQSSSQAYVFAADGSTALQATHSNSVDAATAAASVGAFPFVARSRDAALVLVLPPGNYTAQINAPSDASTGAVLAEIYELPSTQNAPRLTNLSARGRVTATEPLTAGFVIKGGPKRVLVRGIGPALASFGVPPATVVTDPKLTVFNSAGGTVASNDNWESGTATAEQAAFRQRVGAFALTAGGKDAETLATLPDGAYTAQVSGTNAGTALIEIYTELPGS